MLDSSKSAESIALEWGSRKAGCRFHFSLDSGNWKSWPPRAHAKMLEETYAYFNPPEPAPAIQLVSETRVS
jgi:hypothetical protein